MKIRLTLLSTISYIAIIFIAIIFAQENSILSKREIETPAMNQPLPTRITLNNGDSYDFSEGTIGNITGGDLYLSGLKFWANNFGQKGVKDLSNIGTIPLYLADIPESGYTRFGVQVELGHTYVSLAQAGEEGNFIVFRVLSISGESVTIGYVYISQNRITLNNRDSYDFSEGTYGTLTGGDLYLSGLKFWANNLGQMGVKDMDNIGTVPLYRVDIPATGYTKFGVSAIVGHTYVSLAQAGEDGNFIVFRVNSISGESVTIDYIYISQNRITLSNGNSYDFSECNIGMYSGGDFYLSTGLKFYANNVGQRGVKDLGNIGTIPLYQIDISATGYTRFGVSAIVGHTYISLAQQGEEGYFIVFRVYSISGESVTIDYIYQHPNRLTLSNGNSYDFSECNIGMYSGGDFYLSTGLKFYANNVGQRGVIDLGDIGAISLDQVNISESGYTRFGVSAVSGHTYISLAQEGEEGNFIVFRVHNNNSESVTINYLYLTPNRVTLSDGNSYDFSKYIFDMYSGGDFYLSTGLKFYANNVGQRGVQDLGDIGPVPLDQVNIPDNGYTRFGVSAALGHTYVSLAQQGEEGNFIVFRVHAMTSENVTIDYVYKTDTFVSFPDDGIIIPSYALEHNYPNPFNLTTEIVYQIPEAGYVNLMVYNSLGQKIRTLVSRKQLSGRYRAHWDGRNDQGFMVTSGIYIYRLETLKFTDTKKLVLTK